MVDDEVFLVVLDVRQEAREVEAAEVQEQAAEGESRAGFEQVEGDEAGEVAAGGLGVSVGAWTGYLKTYLPAGEHQVAAED